MCAGGASLMHRPVAWCSVSALQLVSPVWAWLCAVHVTPSRGHTRCMIGPLHHMLPHAAPI